MKIKPLILATLVSCTTLSNQATWPSTLWRDSIKKIFLTSYFELQFWSANKNLFMIFIFFLLKYLKTETSLSFSKLFRKFVKQFHDVGNKTVNTKHQKIQPGLTGLQGWSQDYCFNWLHTIILRPTPKANFSSVTKLSSKSSTVLPNVLALLCFSLLSIAIPENQKRKDFLIKHIHFPGPSLLSLFDSAISQYPGHCS